MSSYTLAMIAIVAAVFVSSYSAPMESAQGVENERQERGFATYPCDLDGTCNSKQYCGVYNSSVGFSTCLPKKCNFEICGSNKECFSGTCLLGRCLLCIGCC